MINSSLSNQLNGIRNLSTVVFAVIAFACTSLSADLMVGVNGQAQMSYDTTSVSPTMTFNIQNGSESTDKVVGWSLGLQIVPDAGATGTLEFATASLPLADYLFDGRSGGLFPNSITASTDVGPVFDTDTSEGVIVPASANLLSVTFQSTDAKGTFKISIIGNEFNGSNVTESVDGSFPTVAFANVAFGSTLEVASITAIPEPTALLFVGLVACSGWLLSGYVSRIHGKCGL